MLATPLTTGTQRPYVTSDVPGTGGILQNRPEDYLVEDVYEALPPATTGDFIVLTIEKTGRNTRDVVTELAARFELSRRDIGLVGATARHAIAVQRISIPASVPLQDVLACKIAGIRVLDAVHSNAPVRLADVRFRRYTLLIRRTAIPPVEATRRARAVLDILERAPFAPNWFGDARFGVAFGNAERGRALVLGRSPKPPARTLPQRRDLVSTYQSHLFNEYLAQRIRDDQFARVLPGDWLVDSTNKSRGEALGTEDEQRQLMAGDCTITGPLFGARMPRGGWDTVAAAREWKVLEADGVTFADFARVADFAPGSRRPLASRIRRSAVETTPDGIRIEMELPRGAYATAIVREIVKDAGKSPS